MVLYYGEEREFEITTEQVAEAIAEDFKRSGRNLNALNGDNTLEKFITQLIYDGVFDKEYIKDNYLDEIKKYWESEALSK